MELNLSKGRPGLSPEWGDHGEGVTEDNEARALGRVGGEAGVERCQPASPEWASP